MSYSVRCYLMLGIRREDSVKQEIKGCDHDHQSNFCPECGSPKSKTIEISMSQHLDHYIAGLGLSSSELEVIEDSPEEGECTIGYILCGPISGNGSKDPKCGIMPASKLFQITSPEMIAKVHLELKTIFGSKVEGPQIILAMEESY